MKSIDKVKKSKMGRPKVDTSQITLRLHADVISKIDDFRRTQDDLPTRPEAIRRLVEKALKDA